MTETVTLPKITLEEAKKRLEPTYALVYVDYRDSIESPDQLAEIVATGFCDSIDDNNWIGDQSYDSATEIIKQEFADVDTADIEDELRSEVYDRDRSTPLDDLIKNTCDPVMYYDLDVEIEGYTEDLVKRAKQVAKALRLNYKNHEEKFKSLVANASYGGKLVLLFRGGFDKFYGDIHEKYAVIEDPEVCVMDRWQGSGHSESGFGDFKVRIDRTRFQVDEAAPGYSFAKDVCGMTLGESRLTFTNDRKGVIGPALPRKLTHKEKFEIAYEKKWKEKKECSFGDMNISRHARTPYRNDYPCGNKCEKCGTFWID